MTTILFMTHGRKEYLKQTINSVHANLRGRIDNLVIHSDSADDEFNRWITQTFGGRLIINHGEHGFGNAMRNAWDHLADDYIIHWEDDFILKEQVSVGLLQWILNTSPHLAQIALKRQPWNGEEFSNGGVVECDPDSYTDVHRSGYDITEHQKFFTTNPSMYPRSVMNLGWPEGEHSEGRFGVKLWDKGLYSSYLGKKFDAPKVEHIGYDRGNGSGY